MSEYGNGMSLTEAFNNDKERICAALEGHLIVGENENGWIYEEATPEECKKYILGAFDNAVYHALAGYRSGKALEELASKHGVKPENHFMEYMIISERLRKEQDEREDHYMYEEEFEVE